MPQHLIFEGAELSGKTWLMSQVYNQLEPKYNQSKVVLDGCHWFNCDNGIFGTDKGKPVIKEYLKIFQDLSERNLIIEKFFLSDKIYNRLHRNKTVSYGQVEKKLAVMDFKIILCTFPEDEQLLQKRINDRLNLYPHYKNILQTPAWYIKQQRAYLKEIKKTTLPYLIVESCSFPDDGVVEKILQWIGE